MRILDVVNRIVVVLGYCQVQVELHIGVRATGQQEVSNRVRPYLVYHIVERDDLPGPRAALDELPVPEEAETIFTPLRNE